MKLSTKIWILIAVVAALVIIKGLGKEESFISDSATRERVELDFSTRMADARLAAFYELPEDEDVSSVEEGALHFLYAYMPLADLTDYSTEFYLENVRKTFEVKEEMSWGSEIPEMIFRHFVLPLRVNNEDLDYARIEFYKELKPRVQGLCMADAILEVNHWCHEKVTYQPSDSRTSSPMNTVRNALGRCGEESTFTVAALRAVGIPARQVYTPRWAHTDDNHAWVEAWADGKWYFLGACEPEPVLNLGWFNQPASRGMLMHTKVFGHYEGPEEVMLEGPNFTEVNLIDNYAKTGRADLVVVDEAGLPVPGACVDFCIYNYSEFYPAVKKYTGPDGRIFLTAGLGDMLAWASKDGKYGFSKVSFGSDELVTIVLRDAPEAASAEIDIVPPPEQYTLPPVTPEQRALNDKRLAEEDSLRHAYEGTFPKKGFAPDLLVGSRGNWSVVDLFLQEHKDDPRAEELLRSLSKKDLHDVKLDVLEDSFDAKESVLCPRVANEFLTPYKHYFLETLTPEQKSALKDPLALIAWTKENIQVIDDPTAWMINQSPRGVFESRQAFARGRDIFFVSLARTLGTEARINPVTRKVQFQHAKGVWTNVDWDAEEQKVAPTGTLRLHFKPTPTVEAPGYYRHFTISKIRPDGRTQLLSFDEGEVDMGGGAGWNVFKKGIAIEEGNYILASANRLSDGSVPVNIAFFTITPGKATDVQLVIREKSEALSVVALFEAPSQVQALAGNGNYALGYLEVDKEPTNHALADIARARESFEKWARPVILVCPDEASLERLNKEIAEGRYGQLPSTVAFAVDTDGQIAVALKPDSSRLPKFILADALGKVYFQSEGYTIGLGEQIISVVKRL